MVEGWWKDGLDDARLPFGTDPPRAGVYTCRQSQKGTGSPRANDCALPARSITGYTRVGRARGAFFRLVRAGIYPVGGRDTWVWCPPSSALARYSPASLLDEFLCASAAVRESTRNRE